MSSASTYILLITLTSKATPFISTINKSGPISPPIGTLLKTGKDSEIFLRIFGFYCSETF